MDTILETDSRNAPGGCCMTRSTLSSKPDFLAVLVIAVTIGVAVTLTVQAHARGYLSDLPTLSLPSPGGWDLASPQPHRAAPLVAHRGRS